MWLHVAAAMVVLWSPHAGELRVPVPAPVFIPAGTFRMGATREAVDAASVTCHLDIPIPEACDFSMEAPQREVYLSAFRIDRTEVTVAAYRRCVRNNRCRPDPLLLADPRLVADDVPITSVTWDEADHYCSLHGGHLPTEAQWERAARGRDGRTWPWGNTPREHASNHGRFRRTGVLGPHPGTVMQPDPADGYALLAPVGSFPSGASPEGILDMAGNVAEWTADGYVPELRTQPTVNPQSVGTNGTRTIRGGSFRTPLILQRTTIREGAAPLLRSPDVGFRCAY